jgi:hypothetical protein
MVPPLHNNVIRHGPGVLGRVSLNDLPFHKGKPGGADQFDGVSQLGTHWLVPGENKLRVEVFWAAIGQPGTILHAQVSREPGPPPETMKKIHDVHFPNVWKALPLEEQVIPFSYESSFVVEDDLPAPFYEGAKPERVPVEGTDELHQAVFEAHSALEKQDAEAFAGAMELSLTDLARYYPPNPGISRGPLVKKYQEAFAVPWKVPPFVPEDLLFESRAGNRVVYVHKKTGGYALEGQSLGDPEQSLGKDLFLVRHHGRYRIFR